MQLITDSQTIIDIAQTLKSYSYIAVDTEFLRDRYYYPKLCLIQIATPDNVYLFDPTVEDVDLEPIWKIFENPAIIKVFHDARQDVETILHHCGKIITPIFDTQIAAMALGYGSHTGYTTLVGDFLKKTLDKSSQFSAWAQRPLSDNQLHYAQADVIYLEKLYPIFHEKLTKLDRLHWLKDHFERLEDPTLYQTNPDQLWKKMQLHSRQKHFLGISRALVFWREKLAQTTNTPRNHILKDAALLKIAQTAPANLKSLQKILGTHIVNTLHLPSLLETIEEGINNPIDPKTIPHASLPLHPSQKLLEDFYHLTLNIVAHQYRVCEKLIASSQDLLELVFTQHHPLICDPSNWRYEVFGKTIIELQNGQSGLQIKDNKVVVSN